MQRRGATLGSAMRDPSTVDSTSDKTRIDAVVSNFGLLKALYRHKVLLVPI